MYVFCNTWIYSISLIYNVPCWVGGVVGVVVVAVVVVVVGGVGVTVVGTVEGTRERSIYI